jgi:outer membrane receptor protein involved in Fe transport
MNVKFLIIPVVAAAFVLPPPVYAQSSTLEEITVTARKRTETLEESPVSVRAFTAAEIESAGIETPRDFINLTPNVTLMHLSTCAAYRRRATAKCRLPCSLMAC